MIIKNRSLLISTFLLYLTVLQIALGLLSCTGNGKPVIKRDPKLVIESGDPPKFAISGDSTLKFLKVGGPDKEREAQRDNKNGDVAPYTKSYWEIAPKDETIVQTMDQISFIIYGKVPESFVQIYPKHGEAPPLNEGEIYYVQLSTDSAARVSKFFAIRNGKVVAEKN